MANPSTTGGTGAGTEFLRRTWKRQITSTTQLISGDASNANHIYTIISITLMNKITNATHGFGLYINPDGDVNADIKILHEDANLVPANSTFVFTDKIILTGADDLWVTLTSSGKFDVWCSYIDQEF